MELKEITNTCGNGGLIGGVSKLYLLRHQDALPLINGERYRLNNNVITDVFLKDGTLFTEVGLFKEALDIVEETIFTKHSTHFNKQTLSLNLIGVDERYLTFLDIIKRQNLVALIQTRTGRYYMLGLKGDLSISGYVVSLGKSSGDFQGISLTFTAEDSLGLRRVDDKLVKFLTSVSDTTTLAFPYILPFIFG